MRTRDTISCYPGVASRANFPSSVLSVFSVLKTGLLITEATERTEFNGDAECCSYPEKVEPGCSSEPALSVAGS